MVMVITQVIPVHSRTQQRHLVDTHQRHLVDTPVSYAQLIVNTLNQLTLSPHYSTVTRMCKC